jgi:hypothetical protein
MRRPWLLVGITLLLTAVIAASATACSPSTDASNSTTTNSSAGQRARMAPPNGDMTGMAPPNGGMPGMMSGSTTTTAATTVTTLTDTTETTAQSTTTTLPEGSYGDGIYLVGTDLDSGLYKGTANGGGGHWEISSDANAERYVASGDPTGQFYIKLTSGTYLRLSGVAIAEASKTAADPLLTSDISDGTYRVGYDIGAGWYRGAVDDHMGYWEVSKDANCQSLVANDYAMDAFEVKVKSGQYITLRGVTIKQ